MCVLLALLSEPLCRRQPPPPEVCGPHTVTCDRRLLLGGPFSQHAVDRGRSRGAAESPAVAVISGPDSGLSESAEVKTDGWHEQNVVGGKWGLLTEWASNWRGLERASATDD